MITLPIFLQMTLEYNALRGGALARAALAEHVLRRRARRTSIGQARPASDVVLGLRPQHVGDGADRPDRAPGRLRLGLLVPLLVVGSGLGLLVSQLNNYTLAPIEEERVSEAAGVNSAGGSFGLSFGLAVAGGIMLACSRSPSPTWSSRAR